MGDRGINTPHRMPAVLTQRKRKGVMTWCAVRQGMQHGERGQGVCSGMSEQRQNKNKKKGLTRQTGAVAGASTWPGAQHAEVGAGRGWLSQVHQ